MGFFGILATTHSFSKMDQVDEKGLRNLRGVVRTSYTALNGRCYQNLDAFAPEADWEALECTSLAHSDGRVAGMAYGCIGSLGHRSFHACKQIFRPLRIQMRSKATVGSLLNLII